MNIPTATYRIQLHAGFGFRATADLLDYLHALGISHLYASPVFKARPGSAHGYDIEDPNRLNPELGGHEDFEFLVQRLSELRMGWLQDIVPNHMAYSAGNPLLYDVLENGSRSPFFEFFDIRWDHPAPELQGAVSAPFLGESLEACLEKGEIGLHMTAEGLQVGYYAQRYPLALDGYPQVLCGESSCAVSPEGEAGPEKALRRCVDRLVQTTRLYEARDRRHASAEAKAALWSLYSGDEQVRALVDERLARLQHSPFESGLHELLKQQIFRLRHWTSAGRQINYRRFFDINDLISLRQEMPSVFDFTHHLIHKLVDRGVFGGLRVDHVDGLADPGGYLGKLRGLCGDIYLAAEKILAFDEELPGQWPVQGATGYEFAAHLDALFCLPDHAGRLTRLYQQQTGTRQSFEEIGRLSKQKVLAEQFGGDLANLVDKWHQAIQEAGLSALKVEELRQALGEMVCAMPVYRTYLSSEPGGAADQALGKVLEEAAGRRPDLSGTLDAIARWLAGLRQSQATLTGKWLPVRRPEALTAFEQLCAPLAAKGVEDTALYRYNRLAALNEVGGDPQRLGASPQEFHLFAGRRCAKWPHALNALSTHDTKRAADVRARLLVVAELADEWTAGLQEWQRCNAGRMGRTAAGPVPDPEMEYLLYQILAATLPRQRGELPEYRRRICAFIVKAAREAKQRTSWLAPDADYEQGLSAFVESILDPAAPAFLDLMEPFAARLARFGFFNSLSQTIIQLTAPGIPDIYQGTELCDDSLVDPDNRRPVDFAKRRQYLAAIAREHGRAPLELAASLMAQGQEERLKLLATWVGLQARRNHTALFQRGEYLPLTLDGGKQRHALAFGRSDGRWWCLTIALRFPATLMPQGGDPLGPAVWADTMVRLPSGAPAQWRNLMTGELLAAAQYLPLGQVLAHLPVALLMGEVQP